MNLKNSKHILLVGMPASGKTTIGQPLAHEWNLPFIDMDEWIQRTIGMELQTYWSEYGEQYFRAIERKILFKALNNPKAVIATGGGCPAFMDNMKWISLEYSIYCQCEPNTLLERLKINQRPVFKAKEAALEDIQQLYELRRPFYERANLVMDTSQPIAQILNNLDDQTFINI